MPTLIVWLAFRLVKANAAVGSPVPMLARTLYGPLLPLAVNAGAAAMPFAFVFTVAEAENVPLAPLAGGVKVIGMPLTEWPDSVTVACSGVPNAMLITANCGVPVVAVIEQLT